jgi:hypothetical protein
MFDLSFNSSIHGLVRVDLVGLVLCRHLWVDDILGSAWSKPNGCLFIWIFIG